MPEVAASLPPAVVVISGLDPTGGAGLGADLAVLQSRGCQGLPVPTAWTSQDGRTVGETGPLPAAAVASMLAPLAELMPAAVKIGMLATAEIVHVVVDWLASLDPLPAVVLDPVMLASGGRALLDSAGRSVLAERLLPQCRLVTPNLQEAASLSGLDGEPEEMARRLVELGASSAVVTGGHGAGAPTDLLFDGARIWRYRRGRLPEAHGTGCRFASGCAAGLAFGLPVHEAVEAAGDALALALAAPRRGPSGLLTVP